MDEDLKLIITATVLEKLRDKHCVERHEIVECFANRQGQFVHDMRANNLTNPITRWFISETDLGRRLKIAFIPMRDGSIVIKSAYKPNHDELNAYAELS